MMRLNDDERNTRQAILSEYARITEIASGSLSDKNLRSRANWFLFYEAHDVLAQLVDKLKRINRH